MKQHKFEPINYCFGCVLKECISCGALSLDDENQPYVGNGDWRVVSFDCNKAAKQIEVYKRLGERK